jgi:hypothetical protein
MLGLILVHCHIDLVDFLMAGRTLTALELIYDVRELLRAVDPVGEDHVVALPAKDKDLHQRRSSNY